MHLEYIQKTLAFISNNGYKTDNIEFLNSTAVFLGSLFDVNYVLIDKYSIKNPNITETATFYADGSFIPNIAYKLADTPCETIINKKYCSYLANVCNIFPKDDFLRQNNIESYIGKPLWNSKKEPIGLIAFMDTKAKSLNEEKNIAIVLDIISIKIEEVLEKMFFENQLNLKIDELSIAKEKAEKSEHQLNVAQKIANMGHWELDIANNKLNWSDEVYRILNLKPQELEACEDLFAKNVHPDDRDKVEEEYLNAFKNKKAYEVEYRLMLPSGEIKYILGKGHKKYNDKGNPIYSFGTVIDITKQKKVEQKLVKLKEEAEKSEEKFKKLANLIFDGIVICENEGNVIECNNIFLNMFGYSRKEIIEKNIIQLLFHEKYHEQIRNNRNKKHTLPFEVEGIRKDGTFFPVEIEARNIDFGKDNLNRLVTFRDLTIRKKGQIENKKLSVAIEQSANTIVITDIYGNIEYTNPKFTETTGYTAAEVLGKNPRVLKSGEQSKEFYAHLWQTISAGNIWKGQMKNKSKSGKFYWEQVTITPIKNETGEIKSYLAIKEDITNRKATDEKLQKQNEEYRVLSDDYLIQNTALKQLSNELSEKNRLLLESKDRFINLFEQNPVPLWEQDFSAVIKLLNDKKTQTKDLKQYLDENPDFVDECILNIKILNSNNAALKMFGVKNVQELKSHLRKTNNKKAIEVLKKELVSIGENNKAFSSETELIGKDGSIILANIKSVIIDDYGASIASMIDITAQSKATIELQKAKEIAEKNENSLNEAQKIAHIGSYDLDFLTGFWKSSPALNDIFGIDEAYQRNTNGWIALIHPEDTQLMQQYLEKNIIENKEDFIKEYRIVRNSDKKILWVRGLGKLELDNQGNPKRLVGTIQDISEKKQVLLDLMKAKEKAEESDRLKTEFIQNMSHEIRTPMNGILGFSELLDNPDLVQEKRKLFIEIIKNSTHQLLHIIDDIMEISVLETKQIKAEENPVCVNDLLYELYTVFNIKAANKNISLVLKNGLTNQESTILTDGIKLNKVLSNLLENALKFTDEGFVELGYKLNKDSEPAELEIYVKDSGIGIKPEKQKLIFDRFSQAEKDLSKNVGGLGLGLSIAKENAELLGGKIYVVSKLGEGAAFYVSIPYKPTNITAEIKKEKEKISEKKDKYTILIAEDEEVNFMVLEILLVDKIKLPCTIIHAKNGLEAVELFKTNPDIGLVLMDIKMPKMDGYEATKHIKEFRPNIPIIVQTAYSTPEEKERAFLAGCDDFIAKPISKDILNSVISKYLLRDKNNESA